jgi:hypothetical protein
MRGLIPDGPHANRPEGARPAHVPASTAHVSWLPSGAADGIGNGYAYWDNEAAQRTLNTYQNPATYSGEKRDLVVDYVANGQTSCLYDFSHCFTMDPNGYAWHIRYADLNVGHIVWNASLYPTPFPDVDGLAWRSLVGRHELRHDQRVGDHSEAGYEGLMCYTNTCTRKSAASTAELDTAATTFQARPIPAHTAYKNSSGTKKVNGYNRQSSSRYLAFSNETSGQTKHLDKRRKGSFRETTSGSVHPRVGRRPTRTPCTVRSLPRSNRRTRRCRRRTP